MVICGGCGTRIMIKASVCPKCSAPVDATNLDLPPPARPPIPWLAVAAVVFAFALAGLGAYVLLRLR